jgi:hypothetical protein
MAHGLTCWKCGASLEVAKHCREPTAEEVRDKTAANFCDHFKPKVGAYTAPTGEADAAKAALEALFGKK